MRLTSVLPLISVLLGGVLVTHYEVIVYVKKRSEQRIEAALDENRRELGAREAQTHFAFGSDSPFAEEFNRRLQRVESEQDKLYRERDVARAIPEFPKEGLVAISASLIWLIDVAVRSMT